MRNLVISFLGRDCPGVVFAVSSFLEKRSCNILQAAQTILSGEFAALFIVEAPDATDAASLGRDMAAALEGKVRDLSIVARPTEDGAAQDDDASGLFVISVDGPDKPGLIAAVSGVFARYGVNIRNMNAMLGKEDQRRAMFVFEALIPGQCDLAAFKAELTQKGRDLEQRVSVQHIDIFEAMHRIPPV